MAPAATTAMEPTAAAPPVTQEELTSGEFHRSMPEAKFLDNVEQFVGDREDKDVVGSLQDLHAKYKYSESGLLSQKQSLKGKIPDIEASLDLVQFLQDKKRQASDPMEVKYQLAENIWVNADVPVHKGNILLWIGANCMLEYTLDEAEEMLTKNLKSAKEQQEIVIEDARFVRDQIVTTEVNIARCHNYGVLRRQRQREAAKELEEKQANDNDA
ncbi:unnamed protein product [Amoebophrya sp. A120]|nr:unnamed protein product [Amoebophrya sp. A120]|eukprot:GSA120T00011328001.1